MNLPFFILILFHSYKIYIVINSSNFRIEIDDGLSPNVIYCLNSYNYYHTLLILMTCQLV